MNKATPNPLAAGFYTVPEAARLIQVGTSRRIHGWLRGYAGRGVGPLLTRDFAPLGDTEELSFLDLMEVRFVEQFREAGVKIKSLRIAADALRKELSTNHPFATQRVLIVADKADVLVKEVLRQSAEQAGDIRLRSLVSNNFVMYDAIKQSLLPGVEFEGSSGLASQWAPRYADFPQITINPKVAFGQPVVPRGIPTDTLYSAYKAEKDNADKVAYWYDVSAADVMDAVRFERALDESLRQRAA
jgi:uncharacterized protein (DUF433 family)